MPTTVVGLREQFSLDSMEPLATWNATLAYQPCATTLVGAIQPCLASRRLLDESPAGAKILSVNMASDNPLLRYGSPADFRNVLQHVVEWMRWATETGWTVHIVTQGSGDVDLQRFIETKHPRLLLGPRAFHVQHLHSHAQTFEYYRSVTVVASTRGHGIMVPFGVRTATISLVTHEKVASFAKDIGHPEWSVELTPARRAGASTTIGEDLRRVLTYIDTNRAKVYAEMAQAQARLMAVTARNMRVYGTSMMQYMLANS